MGHFLGGWRMIQEENTWAFLRGYYYPKFVIVLKSLAWDERYLWLRNIYNDANPNSLWEERTNDPIKDMMEYLSRKDYFHFFCMGVTVNENGSYKIHRVVSNCVYRFLKD